MCPNCNGTGLKTCERCKGSGVDPDRSYGQQICVVCHGEKIWGTCSYCLGRGVVEAVYRDD
jgi:DnaJ-class molecular chaperone